VTEKARAEEAMIEEATTGPVRRPATRSVAELLAAAHNGLLVASLEQRPAQRYVGAHVAALRAAAAVLAVRTRPLRGRPGSVGPRSAWTLLGRVAPELGEWAAFFAAGAGRRQAAELGIETGVEVVSTRDADDLLRDAETFVALVETTLGRPHQVGLSLRTVS